MDHIYRNLKFTDEPDDDVLRGMMRVDILSALCHFGHTDCVENSRNRYALWMLEGNPDLNNM